MVLCEEDNWSRLDEIEGRSKDPWTAAISSISHVLFILLHPFLRNLPGLRARLFS